jgi:hypothetical protein
MAGMSVLLEFSRATPPDERNLGQFNLSEHFEPGCLGIMLTTPNPTPGYASSACFVY